MSAVSSSSAGQPLAASGGLQSRCFCVPGADAPALIALFWAQLSAQDADIQALPGNGTGEIKGSHLYVQWARCVEEPLLVCHVVELRTGSIWEGGIAEAGLGAPVVFWRPVAGADDGPPGSWEKAIGAPHALVPHSPRNEPTFLRLLQAMREPSVLASSGDDSAARVLAEEECRYWQALVRTQARAHRAELNANRIRLQAMRDSAGQSVAAEGPLPERIWQYSEIEEWAAANGDRIVILPRALAGGKKAEYHEPFRVFAGLEILAGPYPALRRNEITSEEFKRRCDEVGLDLTRSVDRSVAGSAGDEYFVRWKGRRVFLGHHLRRGTSREPRFALRIYFAWDDADQVVIVGWLASHLTASMS